MNPPLIELPMLYTVAVVDGQLVRQTVRVPTPDIPDLEAFRESARQAGREMRQLLNPLSSNDLPDPA